MKTKFNIELDLSEIYSHYEGNESIREMLLNRAKTQIENKITKDISDSINKEMGKDLQEFAKKEMTRQLSLKMARASEKLKVKKDRRSNEMIGLGEYMQHNLSHSRDDSFKRFLDEKVKTISIEMKKRYDMHFASLVVKRLSENGLLKEGAADILLEKK